MADETPAGSPSPDPAVLPPPTPPRARRQRLWLIFIVLLLLVGGVAAVWWPRSRTPAQPDQPLDGKLTVIVRPAQRAVEPLAVEEPGALPVRSGGIMNLEVQLEQPAYVYLVWLDCEGQVVPLYPWNHDALEVKDINVSPPVRKASKTINNPPIGAGWKFGKKGGVETVLLLARRTPLDEGTRLGPLVGSVPPPKLRNPGEVAVLGLDRGVGAVSTLLAQNRGTDEEVRALDEPLRAAMVRLHDHFEFIRAVRFAHAEE